MASWSGSPSARKGKEEKSPELIALEAKLTPEQLEEYSKPEYSYRVPSNARNSNRSGVADAKNFLFPVMIPKEDSQKVQLWIKLETLRASIAARCKPLRCFTQSPKDHPGYLIKNGEFEKWELTDHSLYFILHIKPGEVKRQKWGVTRKPTGESYRLKIHQFPTNIVPEATELNVRQGETGAFLVLKLIKQTEDIWIDIWRENGQIDAAPVRNPLADAYWEARKQQIEKENEEEDRKMEELWEMQKKDMGFD